MGHAAGQPVQGPAEVQRLHVYEAVKLAAVRSIKHCVGEETQANVEKAVITAVNNCGTWYVQHEVCQLRLLNCCQSCEAIGCSGGQLAIELE